MEEKIDPYFILGVKENATNEEIKRAYRKLSLKCHPDFYPDNPEKTEEFRKLTEAYNLINTLEKRRTLRQRVAASLRHGAQGAVASFFDRKFYIE